VGSAAAAAGWRVTSSAAKSPATATFFVLIGVESNSRTAYDIALGA
jgi:hypothetical protein